jgi:hypothetical protein
MLVPYFVSLYVVIAPVVPYWDHAVYLLLLLLLSNYL